MTPAFDRQRVRAICFDLDGTLVETDDVLVRRLERWLVWRPADRRRALARRFVLAAEGPANAFLTLVDRLGVDEALAPLLDWLHRQRGLPSRTGVPPALAARTVASADALRPVEGSLPALRLLAARFPLALVTAREARIAAEFLEAFHLASEVHCIATARTTRRGKPDPAPILWAAACLRVPPDACLVVGDTTVDIRAGRSAGAQTVGVLCGFGQRRELERAGADLILGSVAELPGVLMEEM